MGRRGVEVTLGLLIAGLLAAAVVAGACGGSGGGEPAAPTFFGTGTPRSSGAFATAAPGDPTVFGTIVLDFTPYGEGAVMPEPPYGLTLLIRTADGENTVSHDVDEDGTFELAMAAGDYEIAGLGIDAPSLQDFPFIHATAGPTFTAPEDGCSYIGLMRYSIYRLPPVETGEQVALTGEIAEETGKDVTVTTVILGGLVQYDETVEAGAPSSGAPDCARDPAEFEES